MVADRFSFELTDDQTIDDAFASVLADWIDAVDRGEKPSLESFVALHPEHEPRLREAIETWQTFSALRDAKPELESSNAEEEAAKERSVLPLSEQGSIGGYQLDGVIGSGGMSIVYKATQKNLQRTVAIKVLRGSAATNQIDLERFRFEAQTVARLDHPNVVSIYEVADVGEQVFFSMQWIDGCNLMQYLSAVRDQPQRAAQILAKTARAVHHAHQRGILHRDLKPSNILIDTEGEPHVTDFGLAKSISVDGELTQPGFLVGTPNYMAPEQTVAESDASAFSVATDVHGLGSILYTVLTGRPPFESKNLLTTLANIRDQAPGSLRRVNPTVPRDLESICFRCLEKRPEDRYASAAALADDLDNFLEGRSVRARPAPPWVNCIRWVRRNRVTTALASSATVLLFALVLNSILGRRRVEDALTRANAHAAQQEHRTELLRQTLHLALAGMTETLPRISDASRVGEQGPEQTERLQRMLTVFEALAAEEDGDTALTQRAVHAYDYVASLKHLLGDRDGAIQAQKRALNLLDELDGLEPAWSIRRHQISGLTDLCHLFLASGRLSEAEIAIEQAQSRIVHDAPHDPIATLAAANVLQAASITAEYRGDLIESRRRATEGLRLVRGLRNAPDADPNATVRLLARLHQQLGDLSIAFHDPNQAKRHLEKASHLWSQIKKQHPYEIDLRPELTENYLALARQVAVSEPAPDSMTRSIEWNRKAVAQCEDLVQDHPEVGVFRQLLARCHHELGLRQFHQGEKRAAEASRAAAEEQYEWSLVQDSPEHTIQVSWGNMLATWAMMHRRNGDLSTATELADQCRVVMVDLQRAGLSDDIIISVASPHVALGRMAVDRGDLESALQHFEDRERRLQSIVNAKGFNSEVQLERVEALLLKATTHRLLNELDSAAIARRDAEQLLNAMDDITAQSNQTSATRFDYLKLLTMTEHDVQLICRGDAEALISRANGFAGSDDWMLQLHAADLIAHAAWMRSESLDSAMLLKRAISLRERLVDQATTPSQRHQLAWLLVAHANPEFWAAETAVEITAPGANTGAMADMSVLVRGLALYRSGRFEDAIETLRDIAETPWRFETLTAHRIPHAMAILSMAYSKTNDVENATRWIESSERWVDRLAPSDWERIRFQEEARRHLDQALYRQGGILAR
ncbi:MAG: serine/threonine-protein kinase [Planctomycetota bacterium]